MLKSILFTDSDLDGAGCRVVYELSHRNECDWKVLNCSPWNVNDVVLETLESGIIDSGTHVIFADICASIDVLDILKDGGFQVDIFDHHVTNYPAQQVFPNAVIIPENDFGIAESGTSLIYKYYGDRDMSLDGKLWEGVNSDLFWKFTDSIRSYDTWEWKKTNNMNAKYLQLLFSLLGMERFCKRYIDKMTQESSKLINDSDMDFVDSKLEFENRVVNEFSEDDIIPLELRGYKAALLLSTKFVNFSAIADKFLQDNPKYDVMIQFSMVNNGGFSFRTIREDLNIGELFASPIGGGGHPQAAGAGMSDAAKHQLLMLVTDSLNGCI